jgi:hypothetical protein
MAPGRRDPVDLPCDDEAQRAAAPGMDQALARPGVVAVPVSTELKLSIAGADAREARKRLGLRKSKAKRAAIWFCDRDRQTADGVRFDLFDRGVIVRLRHKRGRGQDSDTTVKYRREAPLLLPDGWDPRGTPTVKIEGDSTVHNRTVSVDASVSGRTIDRAGNKGRPLAALFSGDQRRFAAAVLAPRPCDLTALRTLGPIDARRWQVPGRDLGIDLAAEQWRTGDLEFLELSVRVPSDDAERWMRRLTEWATEEQLDVGSLGVTKTQAVLEHLAPRRGRAIG